jgi:4-amino-4-deoxy-L-arabinose transferase-like glycosyltransferase
MLTWIVAVLVLAVYGTFVALHVGAWAGGADSSGYLNNARLLRAGHLHEVRRAIEGLPPQKLPVYSYVPLGFIPVPDNPRLMVPTYPVGISLLMIAVSPFTGWPLAPHITMWLHVMAGMILMYALARAFGFARSFALFGAMVLATSPLYLFMGIQAMSDVPAVVWCSASVLFAWYSRKKDLWALAAGFSVAIAVLVRPSDLLIVAPVALCLGTPWRRWFWLALGGAPGAVFLALFNLALYGHAITTGYGDVGGIFQLAYAAPALVNYLQWLPILLTPGIVLVFALPWARGESRLVISILASWTVIFLGFYLFYYHTHETWWYLRFILPTFPPIILMILAGARAVAARSPVVITAAGILAFVLVVAWAIGFGADDHFSIWAGWTLLLDVALIAVLTRRRLAWRGMLAGALATVTFFSGSIYWGKSLSALDTGREEKKYPDAARWARAHLPANSVVLAMQMSGALLYYTDLTFLRYDQFNEKNFPLIERICREKGRPIYSLLFPFEEKEVLEKRYPGRWTQVGAVHQITVWRRDPAPDDSKNSATPAKR